MNNIKRSIKIKDKGKYNHVRKYEVILYENQQIKCTVYRRSRHFYLLSEKIASHYEYIITPDIPEKDFYKKFKSCWSELQKNIYYKVRKASFEYYLNFMCGHEILGKSDVFHFFFHYVDNNNIDVMVNNFWLKKSFEDFYKINSDDKYKEYKKTKQGILNLYNGVKKFFTRKKSINSNIEIDINRYEKMIEKYKGEFNTYEKFKENTVSDI